MKKIFKNKIIIIIIAIVIVVLGLLFIFNRTNENIVTRVHRVLKPKYYSISCIDQDCKYMVAYKGSSKKESTVSIIDSNGKTVSKYEIDNANDKYKIIPVNASSKYVISAIKDDKNYTHGYSVYNSKGKEVLKTEEETLYPITDKFLYGKKDELYTIYDYKGNTLYADTKDLKFYNDNKIISFVTNENIIINEKSERILEDYEIIDEVEVDGSTKYFIVKDKNGVYSYFDTDKERLVGDSFNYYTILSDKKILISKKINNDIKRYVLDTNGKELEEIESKKDISKKVIEGYTIIDDSVINSKQKGILVIFGNSFGTYDLESGEYNKIFEFKNGNKNIEVYNVYDDLKEARLEIGCSETYCNEKTIMVYNPYNNKISLNLSKDGKDIKKYREYKNGYIVVTYTDGMYTLFDDKGNLLLESSNNIVVVDQDELIDDRSGKSNVLLYSSTKKKVLNDENKLALLDTSSNYGLYKYFDDKYMYLFDKNGKEFKKIPIEESGVVYGDKYILHSKKDKANIYNLINNSDITIKLEDDETVDTSTGTPIVPNKGLVIVSNNKTSLIKVYNYKKRVIKKIKKSEVISVNYDEETNNTFLVIKTNKKYSLYIIK